MILTRSPRRSAARPGLPPATADPADDLGPDPADLPDAPPADDGSRRAFADWIGQVAILVLALDSPAIGATRQLEPTADHQDLPSWGIARL